MSPLALSAPNTRPLKVSDIAEMFGVSEYTVRLWAREGKLKGAKKIGRAWRFALDVEYIDDAPPPSPVAAQTTQSALDVLREYRVNAA